MKNILFLILVIFGCLFFRAQELQFSYDTAGNQTLRFFTYNGNSHSELSLFELSEMIIIYPNPTHGVVNIEWGGGDMEGMVYSIRLQSYNANYVQEIEMLSDEHSAIFDITGQATGLYFTQFVLIDGRVITKTLIKY